MIMPAEVTTIPQFLLFKLLGWTNTYLPLTVPSYFGGGAFTVFLLRQFFLTLPRDLDDAATIDGAGTLRILVQILLPLSRPALASGADELIVCDTHHGGGNLDLARLTPDRRITYLGRSTGYQDGQRRWMPGLDRSVDALMLPGHHARAGTARAFLPHTWSRDWADFRINGQSVGEIGIEACYAGHWDVPLILVQGDEAGCQEASEQFPGVVTAAVKRAISEDLCEGLDEEEARRLTAARVAEAIAGLRRRPPAPFKPALPMTVTVRMHSAAATERATGRPTVQRVDELTVQGRVDRQCDVVKWLLGTGLDMPPEQT